MTKLLAIVLCLSTTTVQAMDVCTAAKTKVKGRYARVCPYGWIEDDTALRSYECDGYDFYFILDANTNSTPNGYQWFRVFQRETCEPDVPVCDGGSWLEYVQCSCEDSSPCIRLSA